MEGRGVKDEGEKRVEMRKMERFEGADGSRRERGVSRMSD